MHYECYLGDNRKARINNVAENIQIALLIPEDVFRNTWKVNLSLAQPDVRNANSSGSRGRKPHAIAGAAGRKLEGVAG
jgi:hypothetical protein